MKQTMKHIQNTFKGQQRQEQQQQQQQDQHPSAAEAFHLNWTTCQH